MMLSRLRLFTLLALAIATHAQQPVACPSACSQAQSCEILGTRTYTCTYNLAGSSAGFYPPTEATSISVRATSGHGGSTSDGLGGSGATIEATWLDPTTYPPVMILYPGGTASVSYPDPNIEGDAGASNRVPGGKGGAFTGLSGESGSGGGAASLLTLPFDGFPDAIIAGAGGGACPTGNGGNAGLANEAGQAGESRYDYDVPDSTDPPTGVTGGEGGSLTTPGAGGLSNGQAGRPQGGGGDGPSGEQAGAGGGGGGYRSGGSGATFGVDQCSGGGGGSSYLDLSFFRLDSSRVDRNVQPGFAITYTLPEEPSGGPQRRRARLARHRRKLEKRVDRERRLGLRY